MALLIAVKLLSSIWEHRPADHEPATVPAPAASTGRNRPGQPRSRPVPADAGNSQPRRSGTGTTAPRRPGNRMPPAPGDLAAIWPAARAAHDELRSSGQPLTRDALAASLRQAGHKKCNARLTALLRALRNEAPLRAPNTKSRHPPNAQPTLSCATNGHSVPASEPQNTAQFRWHR